MATKAPHSPELGTPPNPRDWPFYGFLWSFSSAYVLLIIAMLLALGMFTTVADVWSILSDGNIQYSIKLSLVSCTATAILSAVFATPIGYLLSRIRFPGRALVDVLLDIPIVLPPLVIGLALLIFFNQSVVGSWMEARAAGLFGFVNDAIPGATRLVGLDGVQGITYDIPAVILAQFAVACAFAVRTMRVTFDQIDPRRERVALTLGMGRLRALWLIVLPEARPGIVTALTLSWARALGEFGPILVFAGTTRKQTEVLSSSVFLELSIGELENAVAVSMLMIIAAMIVLLLARMLGQRGVS